MKVDHKFLGRAILAASCAIAVGCAPAGGEPDAGDMPDAGNTVDAGDPGFQQPAGTVAVNFTIDDTANKVFTAGELGWKGSMKYDAETRIITHDSTWSGPWATLHDDGPWSAGGHEPAGSVAGDKKWGITVFVMPPEEGEATYEYGSTNRYCAADGALTCDNWIWIGSNGSFKVASGATAAITAAGLTLPPFGTYDFQLVIDKNALAAGTTWDTSEVKVKGSGWGWTEITLMDDGAKGDATAADGKYTMKMSEYVGAGKMFKHAGLFSLGQKIEFIAVFKGTEYKTGDGTGDTTGITASVKAPAGSFHTEPITINSANKNPQVEITNGPT